MKRLWLVLSFFISVATEAQEDSTYRLLDLSEKSNFNYLGIDSIHSRPGGIIMLDSVFNVIQGDYTVYRFITSYRPLYDKYHLIILKVDKRHKIVDGYQYLLPNVEMPFTCKLYRASRKITLKPGIKVSDLKFKKVHKEIKGFEMCTDIPTYLPDDRRIEIVE